MDEIKIGEIIRQARLSKGLSQKQLSAGICSYTTLSRYENDSRVPSKKTYDKLMSRLGVSGFLYEEVTKDVDYTLLNIQKDVMREMFRGFITFRDSEMMHEKMYAYLKLAEEEDLDDREFIKLVEAHWIFSNSRDISITRLNEVADIISQTCREGLAGLEAQISEGDVDYVHASLSTSQMMIINLLAISEYMKKNFSKALELELWIYKYLKTDGGDNMEKEAHIAYVCNNIAVFLQGLGLHQDALLFAKRAVKLSMINNCMVASCMFLKTRASCYGMVGQFDSKKKDEELVRLIAKELKNSCDINFDISSVTPTQIF